MARRPVNEDGSRAGGLTWWSIHPLLAGVVPVLVLWGANAAEVPARQGLRLALIMLAAGLVTWLVTTVVLRMPPARAAVVSTVALLAFSFVGGLPTGAWLQLGLFAVVCLGGLWLARTLRPTALRVLSIFLTLVLSALLVANAGLAVVERPSPARAASFSNGDLATSTVSTAARPDVWVIVPDRYARADALQRRGLDDTDFLADLETRGFDVLGDASANYPQTLFSLASAWNLELIDAEGLSGPSIGGAATASIDNHRFGRLLTDAGYEYLHVGPWTDFTAAPAVADEVLSLPSNSDFTEAWIQGTAIAAGLQARGWEFDVDGRQRRHSLHQLDVLDELSRADPTGPQLVMAHLLLPHHPYVFAADGGPATATTSRRAYDGQRRYLDGRLLTIIDRLVARPDPPLIVLAADEGLYPEDWTMESKDSYDWGTISADQGEDKMGILAAVRPARGAAANPIALDDDLTLVNIMRWTTNEAIATALEPLPDDRYLYRGIGWSRMSRLGPPGADLPK